MGSLFPCVTKRKDTQGKHNYLRKTLVCCDGVIELSPIPPA